MNTRSACNFRSNPSVILHVATRCYGIIGNQNITFNISVNAVAADGLALSRCHLKTYIVHYGDVIIGAMASQITSLTIVYSTVYSHADQRKHQSSASLAFVWGIHRGPVNSPHKWPVTRKMFPFDDVIIKDLIRAPYKYSTGTRMGKAVIH